MKIKKDFSSSKISMIILPTIVIFTLCILSMTKSAKIAGLSAQMWDLLDFYLIHVYEDLQINFIDSWNEHNQIYEAIKSNDKQKAKEVMENHLNSYIQKVPSAQY